jgi:hypothetical protein
LPISAVDAVNPAIEHTKQQLLKPFRINQWAKLALVGFLAGELSSGGGCNAPSFPGLPHKGGNGPHMGDLSGLHLPHFDPATVALVITLVVAGALLFGILFMYLSSMMRFVLFDSVVTKRCEIRESWRRRHAAGIRLFFWHILLAVISWGVMLVMIGIPALIAFSLGWFSDPGEHVAPLVLGGIFVFPVFFVVVIATLVVTVLTKDFVVPQMALEDISAIEGWRRLVPMIKSEIGSYAAYIGMKIVLSMGAAIIFGIATAVAVVLLLIPAALIGLAVILAGKAAGLTWTPIVIAWGVVAVIIAFVVILYVVSFVSVPGIVFFPAYALYFFAARYPALNAILHPAPLLPPPPPPFLPPPEPIG